MRLTATMDAITARTVGTMIQPRLRASARPSVRTSRSLAGSAAAARTRGAGAGLATAGLACGRVFSLLLRQNAKRMILPQANATSHHLSSGNYTPLRLLLG